jgi:hypothetical protein
LEVIAHQRGRENEVETLYRKLIAKGHASSWLDLGNFLKRQKGRETDAEYAYRQAIATSRTTAARVIAYAIPEPLIPSRLTGTIPLSFPSPFPKFQTSCASCGREFFTKSRRFQKLDG